MTRSGTAATAVGDAAVLGTVVRSLAYGGPVAAGEALRGVLDGCPQLRGITLRAAAGTGAGEVVAQAVREQPSYGVAPPARRPLDDQWVLDVPVRRRGQPVAVLTAVSTTPFTAAVADLLTDVAAVFALAAVDVPDAAAQAVLDVEADLAAVAAELDEAVGETLVALRHVEPNQVAVAAGAALESLRRIRRDLRATSLDDGLRAALAQLRDYGAVVSADDPALDTVGPAAGVLVERVAELACRSAVGTPQIVAFLDGDTVKLRVDSADNAVDASELARWRRRADALRGELRHLPRGVEMTLPTHP